MKTFQHFTSEAYGRRPVRGRDYDDYKGMKPRGLGGNFQTQDKTPPTHPAAHLKPKKKSAAERMDAAGKRLGLPESTVPGKPAEKLGAVTAIPQDERKAALERIKQKTAALRKKKGIVEDTELDEGMTMKGFKKQRSRQKQKEKRAADKIAPNRRKDIHTDRLSPERAARHRANVDPDFEGNDERNYPGGKLNPKKVRKAKALGELGEEAIDEILMITPTTKKTATKSQSKPKRDPYGEDPSVTRKRLAAKVKKLKEEGEIDEGIGMTMANAIGNPPALSKRMKLKQALIINKIRSDAKKNKEKKYSGKAATEEYDLSETSLNRVRSKSQKGGMAIMSAQRGDKSKKENKARSSQLEKDIRGAGLPGPTKVSGRYTENPGTSQEKKVGEKSHVVSSGKMGKRKFKKAIEKLGKKYDQDSVLIQRKPKGSATIKGTSKTSWPGKGKNVGVGKMNPGKTGEFDTKVKNKTFTYEEYEN
jgi:hypothetical protein